MREGNIVVRLEGNETAERAFKRFKRKCEKIKLSRRVRERMQYEKPSRRRRLAREKAIYKQKMFASN